MLSIVWRSEIRRRSSAERLVKGDGERAWCGVATLKRDLRNARSAAKPLNRMHQAGLLTPAAEREARFGKKRPLNCPTARARIAA